MIRDGSVLVELKVSRLCVLGRPIGSRQSWQPGLLKAHLG